MARYRYYLFDRQGALKAADEGGQVTDFAAMDHARDLLAPAHGIAGVQIWRGEAFVTGLGQSIERGIAAAS
jgi:hypothetical protein